jgi:Xaa-Pro aminopeptidase
MTTITAALPGVDLDSFRAVQQLAYRCAEDIAAELQPGVTEREVCERMQRYLLDRGVDDWFHTPFAWFGDRTAFRGFKLLTQFLPSGRRLEEGMAYILDCAPVVRGATADIGYAGAIGGNPVLELMLDDLAAHRALILELVRARRPFAEIYAEVDALAAHQGFQNRHQAYPGHVLAHEIRPLGRGRGHGRAGPFGLRHLRQVGRGLAAGRVQGWSPLWNGGRHSAHAPHPGLWAVEPHLGFRDVGAKFEELLVITEDDAFWLDDDLPHVRRWRARGIG